MSNQMSRIGGQHSKQRRTALGAVLVSSIAAVTIAVGSAAAAPSSAPCPALYALGVQGTGQSAPDADPHVDTGFLQQVFRPLLVHAGSAVQREYIPYEAGFGGFVAGGNVPYTQSVDGGLTRLRESVNKIAARCPSTRFAIAGYSQGAHVVSMFLQELGRGTGTIPADKVAAAALFGDPTRNPGSGLFPGAPGRQVPETVPGTAGTAVRALPSMPQPAVAGGGIGPERDVAANFGALTGRVMSVCVPGDLVCAAPSNAPILRVVANVAGQSQFGGDPVQALASVSQAVAFTAVKTGVTVMDQDVTGNSLASLSYSPRESLSQRIAEASDPRTPLDPSAAIRALFRVGTIGLNAVVTVAKTVLTPENIAELSAVGVANPAAAVALLSSKVVAALPQLVPPDTQSRWVQEAFDAVKSNVTDNRDLLNVATWLRFSDTIQAHNSYGTEPVASNGSTATTAVADWFTAAAKDLGAVAAGGNGLHNLQTPTQSPESTR